MYADLDTNVISMIDERIFGTKNMHFKDVKIDWEEVYSYWYKFASYCKRHHYG